MSRFFVHNGEVIAPSPTEIFDLVESTFIWLLNTETLCVPMLSNLFSQI